MKDILGQLYNGFLLRDVLGYVVPGAFVLACLTHLTYIINSAAVSQVRQLVSDSGLGTFFLICLCYICGHFLSGIFFHSSMFRWMFRYTPDLSSDYPNMSKEQAWSTHRSTYKRSCKCISDSMQSYVERHASLLHFTGHISASFLFTALYLAVAAVSTSSYNLLLYIIPFAILFPGIYTHYRRLYIERYYLEVAAIRETSTPAPLP